MLRDQVRIEAIAQRVAQQVKGHHADEQRQPRPDHLQRLGPDILPGVVDHHPPFRRRRADAEAKERHAGHVKHHMTDIQRGEHQQRGDHRPCQMVAEQPPLAGAAQAGGEDKFALAQGDHQITHHSGVPGPVRQRNGEDHVGQPGSQHPHHKERQDRGRKGHKQFGEAHQAAVGAAAQQPGAAANRQTDQQHQQQAGHYRPQRDAGGGQQARENIPSKMIGSQPVRPPWRQQPLLQVNRRRIPGQPPAAAEGDDRQQRDNQQGQFHRPAEVSQPSHTLTSSWRRRRGSSAALSTSTARLASTNTVTIIRVKH